MMNAVPSPSGESAVSPLVSLTARAVTPGDGGTSGGTAIRPAPTRATPKVPCRRSIRGLSLGVRSCSAPSNGEQNYSTTASGCEARSPKSFSRASQLPVARRVVLEEAAVEIFAGLPADDGVINTSGTVDQV